MTNGKKLGFAGVSEKFLGGRLFYSIEIKQLIVAKVCKNGVLSNFSASTILFDKTNTCYFFIGFQVVYSCPPNWGGV